MNRLDRIRLAIKLKMEALVARHAYELYDRPDSCIPKSIEGAIRALDEVLGWIDDRTEYYPTDYRLESLEGEREHWQKLLEESKSKSKP